MWNDRIIGDTVVCNEEGPASFVTVVFVTSMKDIGVEEESIPGLHLYINQWKHLKFKKSRYKISFGKMGANTYGESQ